MRPFESVVMRDTIDMLSNPESAHKLTEKDLDQELEKALRGDASFLRWFVSKTKFKDAEPELA